MSEALYRQLTPSAPEPTWVGSLPFGTPLYLSQMGGRAVDLDPGEPGRVAPVDVDPGDHLRRPGGDVVDHDVALERVGAVAAGAVELAGVLHVEAGDVDRAVAVVLEHLVAGGPGAAADDVAGAAAGAHEGRGVLADVLPPDVLDGAGTEAVNAVAGRSADDAVLDRRAVGQLEDRVLALALAAGLQLHGVAGQQREPVERGGGLGPGEQAD